jgi:hypothetical protein
MAGETTKTTALTNRDSQIVRDARLVGGKKKVTMDTYQFAAATSLEAADNLILDMPIPSNAIVTSIQHINDDLDTDACPTLVVDIGVAAREQFTSTTSSSDTVHAKDSIVDADLFIDGNTAFQAATTAWTEAAAPDATTFGPEDRLKPVWELLGYDNDPKTTLNIVFQSQAASAALSSAGDMALKVEYIVD